MATSPLSAVLRLVSRIACLIVIASFAIFVVHQAGNASNNQQNEVNSDLPTAAALPTTSSSHESTPHKVIDEVADKITSPFKAITSGSSSQWLIRGTNLVLTLLIYGFGLGFLARVLRA